MAVKDLRMDMMTKQFISSSIHVVPGGTYGCMYDWPMNMEYNISIGWIDQSLTCNDLHQ